jgi:hypothetical protein
MTGPVSDATIEWHRHPLREGVRIGRRGDQLVVDWRGIGRLFSSVLGDAAEFVPHPGVEAGFLEKFRATSLVACRRYLAGGLSLHGSAVQLASDVIVLVGDSGAGKSTTAMALVEEEGAAFLADDIVPVDWHGSLPVVPPMSDTFWLAKDASAWFGLQPPDAEKLSHPPRRRATKPERLSAIVHLTFDDSIEGVAIDPVGGQDKFLILSHAHVCYPTSEEGEPLRNLAARARLAASAPLYRLRRRRSLAALALTGRALADRLRSLRHSEESA